MSEPLSSPALREPEYLTPAQVAELLQVSDATVYRWAKNPTMPVLRIGGTVRFPRERLLRWLRDSEQGPGRPRQSRKQMLGAGQLVDLSASGQPGTGSWATPWAQEAPK